MVEKENLFEVEDIKELDSVFDIEKFVSEFASGIKPEDRDNKPLIMKSFRTKAGMTSGELCGALGFTMGEIAAMEEGRQDIPILICAATLTVCVTRVAIDRQRNKELGI